MCRKMLTSPRRAFVALFALQDMAEVLAPALFGNDPGSVLPGRCMAYMLVMATGEPRYPVTRLILCKADYFLFQDLQLQTVLYLL